MPQYQGHRSWNAWNVALWIGNDEGLYLNAMFLLARHKTVGAAARAFLRDVGEGSKTPDGGVYNYTSVREALAGLRD